MSRKKDRKKKIVLCLEKEVYDRLMEVVFYRVQDNREFRGVLSEVVNDVLRTNLKDYATK